jgi:hypothetical protein
VRIADGRLAIGSLERAGFAAGAQPDWSSMREVAVITAPERPGKMPGRGNRPGSPRPIPD